MMPTLFSRLAPAISEYLRMMVKASGYFSTKASSQARLLIVSGNCGVRPGNLLAQELDHLPLGKEALGLLGIGELERLEQESLGLKRVDHYHQDNNGRSLDRVSWRYALSLSCGSCCLAGDEAEALVACHAFERGQLLLREGFVPRSVF